MAELLHGRPKQEVDLTKNEGLRIFVDGKEIIDGRTVPAPDVFPAIEDSSTHDPENFTEY